MLRMRKLRWKVVSWALRFYNDDICVAVLDWKNFLVWKASLDRLISGDRFYKP